MRDWQTRQVGDSVRGSHALKDPGGGAGIRNLPSAIFQGHPSPPFRLLDFEMVGLNMSLFLVSNKKTRHYEPFGCARRKLKKKAHAR